MYAAHVNNTSHEVVVKGSSISVDGRDIHWDLIKLADGHFHIINDGKSYRVEVVSDVAGSKGFIFKINGQILTVDLKDKFDLLLEKLGMNSGTSGKLNNIKAPMPGLIIDLRVKDGDDVYSGDTLLILEAMKMENVIKAPADGKVKVVKVKKGDSVEKNQILIEF